jgi:hypothetical protein
MLTLPREQPTALAMADILIPEPCNFKIATVVGLYLPAINAFEAWVLQKRRWRTDESRNKKGVGNCDFKPLLRHSQAPLRRNESREPTPTMKAGILGFRFLNKKLGCFK